MPYISPFVIDACNRAKERSRLKHKILTKQTTPLNNNINKDKENEKTLKHTDYLISSEWNNDTKTCSLFDPYLKKQEIFKPVPRKKSPFLNKDKSVNTPTQKGLTLRTGKVS